MNDNLMESCRPTCTVRKEEDLCIVGVAFDTNTRVACHGKHVDLDTDSVCSYITSQYHDNADSLKGMKTEDIMGKFEKELSYLKLYPCTGFTTEESINVYCKTEDGTYSITYLPSLDLITFQVLWAGGRSASLVFPPKMWYDFEGFGKLISPYMG